VAAQVPITAGCIAELGPGTGPITRALLARAGSAARVLALEIDPAFGAALRRALPDPRLVVLEAPAQELPDRAAALGLTVDAVVSGLPFANFGPATRREIVQAAYDALAPEGVFAGYGYAPFALPPVLRLVFGNCRASYVWRNVPPAFVFVARKRARSGLTVP
jgi:phospholipid N-methyltransferase